MPDGPRFCQAHRAFRSLCTVEWGATGRATGCRYMPRARPGRRRGMSWLPGPAWAPSARWPRRSRANRPTPPAPRTTPGCEARPCADSSHGLGSFVSEEWMDRSHGAPVQARKPSALARAACTTTIGATSRRAGRSPRRPLRIALQVPIGERGAGPEWADVHAGVQNESAGLLGQPGARASQPRQADPSPQCPQHRPISRQVKGRNGLVWVVPLSNVIPARAGERLHTGVIFTTS